MLSRELGIIDTWIKSSDQDAFGAIQKLMRKEGVLVGGSCGSAIAGALKWLKESEEGCRVAETRGANVVVLLPDGYVLHLFELAALQYPGLAQLWCSGD